MNVSLRIDKTKFDFVLLARYLLARESKVIVQSLINTYFTPLTLDSIHK